MLLELYAQKSKMKNPENLYYLYLKLSQKSNKTGVRHGDDHWFDIWQGGPEMAS